MALVLIVDDSDYQRIILRDILESNGYEVIEASNGQEGIDSASANKPGCIFLDITMPGVDGMEAIGKIREVNKDTPIIVISANVQEETTKACLDKGATDFVAKPILGEAKESLLQILKCYVPES